MSDATAGQPPSKASLIQPIIAGSLAAFAGFAGSFTILLAGYAAVGASPAEGASGLFAVSVTTGLLDLLLSCRAKMPITITWSSPGAAVVVSAGANPDF